MSGEIKKRVLLKLTNGKDKFPGDDTVYTRDQATTRPAALLGQHSVNVSTDAALTMPLVAAGNLGEAVFYNLDTDTTKYIDIGPVSGGAIVPCARVYGSGPPASFQLIPSTTYRAVASSGTQVLLIGVLAK